MQPFGSWRAARLDGLNLESCICTTSQSTSLWLSLECSLGTQQQTSPELERPRPHGTGVASILACAGAGSCKTTWMKWVLLSA